MADNGWVIGKYFLSHVWAPSESKVKSLQKVKYWSFSNDFFFNFQIIWTSLVSIRVKGMLSGGFWCLVCVNWIRHCWVMAVCVWFLGFDLLKPRNVSPPISGCKKKLKVFFHINVVEGPLVSMMHIWYHEAVIYFNSSCYVWDQRWIMSKCEIFWQGQGLCMCK